MAILVGAETTGAAEIAVTAKKGVATKRVAGKTGKLKEISITLPATNKTEKVTVGIRADSGGAVGAALAESAETAITKEKAETFTIALTTEIEVTEGTTYWLCIIPNVGNLKIKATEKAGFGFITTAAITKVSEGTWTTAENKFGEPSPIWGSGTETSTKLKGKATGELLLTGTSKGVAAQRVSGKASDKLLLTGTSKGVAVQVVKGVAAGTLLLTGTSKASLASVLKGNASGALLLTGTSTGVAAQRISAHAAGELLLTGAAKGTVAEGGLKGHATGTLLLTGSGAASTTEILLAKASGTLFFLGAASGSASEKTGKRAIFIFDE